MNEHQREYVKLLTSSMYDVQKVRLAIEGRIRAFLQTGGVSYLNMAEELKAELAELATEFEKGVERRIKEALKSAEIMKWLDKVSGIGPRYAGTLVGMIGAPPDTVSKMWSLCGMSVIPVCADCQRIAYEPEEKARFISRQVERRWEQRQKKEDGESADQEGFKREQYVATEKKLCQCEDSEIMQVAPKRQYYKGLLLTHSPFLKSACWKIAGQFVRQGKFYRTFYEQRKEYYIGRDGASLTALHIENRARRATVKLFLSHLWEMWRKSLGQPAGEIYLKHKLGEDFDRYHTYIAPPYDDLFD